MESSKGRRELRGPGRRFAAPGAPQIDFCREVTVGDLLADITTAHGLDGKVNPPLRPRDDVEALWEYVLDGTVDWVVSDHACCREDAKFGEPKDDVFLARSGFGGAEYLLPGLITEGTRRGLPLGRIAALTSWNPARRYGVRTKGALAPGFDADIALVDPDRARRGVRVDAGVHPVRGLRADRPGHGHLPERPSHPAGGQDHRRARGRVPPPASGDHSRAGSLWGSVSGGEPGGHSRAVSQPVSAQTAVGGIRSA
ncbi:amidohydrolase family protein [Streptomyces phaeochromogenes]